MIQSFKRKTKFNDDLIKYGKTGEIEVAKFFKQRKYNVSELNDNSDYDFIINKGKKTFKVEVKNDVKCITPSISYLPTYDTGNMFIEYCSWGKKGGIEATKSDLFCYLYSFLKPKELWIIPTENLKTLINKNDFLKTNNSGDEGSGTEGYLIPRYEFKEHFTLYKYLNDKWNLIK
jgi:hypothetical protein